MGALLGGGGGGSLAGEGKSVTCISEAAGSALLFGILWFVGAPMKGLLLRLTGVAPLGLLSAARPSRYSTTFMSGFRGG